MSYSRQPGRHPAIPTTTAWTVRRKPLANLHRVPEAPPRRFEFQWLEPDGDIGEAARIGPSIPLFTDSFAALGRGTMLAGEHGPVAVEDALPGMRVVTTSGLETLVWIGRTTLLPSAARAGDMAARLYRIPADAFGLGRPQPDLVLGPSARMVDRSPALRAATAKEAALVPVAPMADGMSVIEVTPGGPVQVFQLGFAAHRLLPVNGIEVESFYPDPRLMARGDSALAQQFLSFLPHLSALGQMGQPLLPRLSADQYRDLSAA